MLFANWWLYKVIPFEKSCGGSFVSSVIVPAFWSVVVEVLGRVGCSFANICEFKFNNVLANKVNKIIFVLSIKVALWIFIFGFFVFKSRIAFSTDCFFLFCVSNNSGWIKLFVLVTFWSPII